MSLYNGQTHATLPEQSILFTHRRLFTLFSFQGPCKHCRKVAVAFRALRRSRPFVAAAEGKQMLLRLRSPSRLAVRMFACIAYVYMHTYTSSIYLLYPIYLSTTHTHKHVFLSPSVTSPLTASLAAFVVANSGKPLRCLETEEDLRNF